MLVGLLAAVAVAHLGFQLWVTLVAYPRLARTPPRSWAEVHDRHSRRVVAPVVVLYGALVLTVPTAWATAAPEEVGYLRVAAGCLALVLATTAVLAAPLHGRLAREPVELRPALTRRLLRVDRLRLVGAAALAGAAVGALAA